MEFYVWIDDRYRTTRNGPFPDYATAERRKNHLSEWDFLRIWIETDSGQEVPEITPKIECMVKEWLKYPMNPYFSAPVVARLEPVLPPEDFSPVAIDVQQIRFHVEWMGWSDDTRMPVTVDQYGRKIEGERRKIFQNRA